MSVSLRVPVVIAALSLFSACAIHPVPEDVTGIDTYQIVRQIRCETRQAVIDFLMRELRRDADLDHDPISQRLVQKYESDPESIKNFTPNLFVGPDYVAYRHLYNTIYTTAIAYSFDLTMTEDNNLNTTNNLLGPWASKFTLNIMGDANRERINERTFTVTDNFQFLLASLNAVDNHTGQHYCDGMIATPNYIYPIAGQIGVYKSVMTFFQLVVLGNLSKQKAAAGVVDVPAMTDDLKFTTFIDLSLTPKVVFTPVGSGFQFADAALTGLNQRKDVHEVTIGLATEASVVADVGPLRGFLFPGQGSAGGTSKSGAGTVVGASVIASVGSKAEQNAAKAVDQVKSKQIKLIVTPN
jgi:hypothetical protein